MGRYFGREPRFSREEIERQAQETIDALVSTGRPPEHEFAPVQARLAELDREIAAREPAVAVPDPPSVTGRPLAPTRGRPLSLAEVRLPSTATEAKPASPTPLRVARTGPAPGTRAKKIPQAASGPKGSG